MYLVELLEKIKIGRRFIKDNPTNSAAIEKLNNYIQEARTNLQMFKNIIIDDNEDELGRFFFNSYVNSLK